MNSLRSWFYTRFFRTSEPVEEEQQHEEGEKEEAGDEDHQVRTIEL